MKTKFIYNPAISVDLNNNTSSEHTIPEVNEAFINLSQLKRNYIIIRSLISPTTKLMIVLKGDACGHGMVPIANEIATYNCDAFGVARLSEGITLRKAGIQTPIMLLSPIIPSQSSFAVQNNIIPMVDNEEIISILNKCAYENKKVVNVHVKVNTGLNRFGVNPNDVTTFIHKIHKNYPNIFVEGVYTHFQDPDYNQEGTKKQIETFNFIINQLEKENIRPEIIHASNSTGALKYPEAQYDMVRCGTILFGLEHEKGEKQLPKGMNFLLTLKSRILKIQYIKAGESGGYGSKFIAKKDCTVAIVGIGYGDGVSRNWKEVLIRGKRVPIVNYFMDGLMVDISDLGKNVQEFDEVVIIGTQENQCITWLEACENLNSYTDEQIQRITERVPRIYFYE